VDSEYLGHPAPIRIYPEKYKEFHRNEVKEINYSPQTCLPPACR
jgi:hypothetical protein